MSSTAESFLNSQIDLYAAQSEAAEADFAKAQAVGCEELEDAIALGLTTFANLRRHDQSWATDAAVGKANFSWDVSRRFNEQYQRWKEMTAVLLKVVDRRKMQQHDLVGEGKSGYVALRAYFFYTANETHIHIVDVTVSADD